MIQQDYSPRPGVPHITCLMPTWCRPRQLSNAIHCFAQFNYPKDRIELLVLDDAGHYPTHPQGENWQVISLKRRFASLGDKRNALAAIADKRSDLFLVMDDDDAYLPWYPLMHAWAYQQAIPEGALVDEDRPVLVLSKPSHFWKDVGSEAGTGAARIELKTTGGMFHAGWAYSRDLFFHPALQGYDLALSNGEDQVLGSRAAAVPGVQVLNPCFKYPPAFIYRWCTSGARHLSSIGGSTESGYDSLRSLTEEVVARSHLVCRPEAPWSAIAHEHLNFPLGGSHLTDLPDTWSLYLANIQFEVRPDLQWPKAQ